MPAHAIAAGPSASTTRAQTAAAATAPQRTSSAALTPKLPPVSRYARTPMTTASTPATNALALRDTRRRLTALDDTASRLVRLRCWRAGDGRTSLHTRPSRARELAAPLLYTTVT